MFIRTGTFAALFSMFLYVAAPTGIILLLADRSFAAEAGTTGGSGGGSGSTEQPQQSIDVNSILNSPDLPPNVGVTEDGYAQGAGRGYTPAQTNPLLGKSLIMTAMECAQKYGPQFCACTKLEDGQEVCYHQTPSAGYYDMATCEAIWGSGQCVSDDSGAYYHPSSTKEPEGMSCLDQVFFFPGEKMECRKSGIMTAGKDCCMDEDEESNSCSFENLASEIGMDDIVMTALSISMTINDLVGLTGTSLTQMAANKMASVIVESVAKNGLGALVNLSSTFGNNISQVVSQYITEYGIEKGTQVATQTAAQAATQAIASNLATAMNIISWAYTAYQIYNMVQAMRQCSAGEMILGCKIAKNLCHSVGSRCKVKVFGVCLQSMKVYCCFNTQIARIIHEQGRPQIPLGWGSGKNPKCRGFYANEFVSLDFGRMDFSEYASEITKQMRDNIAPDIENAVKKAMENFSIQ